MENRIKRLSTFRRSALFHDDEQVFGSHSTINPSYTRPKFGDTENWNLAAADTGPNLGVATLDISFGRFTGAWNLRARELAMMMLNPNHPKLVVMGLSGIRKVPKVRGVVNAMRCLWNVYLWAVETAAPTDLSLWTPTHANNFLEASLEVRSPATVHAEVGAFRMLYIYRDALTDGGIPIPPWPVELSNASIAGYRVGGSLSTEPLSPSEWAAVVNAAWMYVDKFEPDIRAAREKIVAPFVEGEMGRARARKLVQEWLSNPDARIPVFERSQVREWKGNIAYQRLLVEVTGYRWRQPKQVFGKVLLRQIEARARSEKTTGGVEMAYEVDSWSGEKRPWRVSIERPSDVQVEETYLRTACYIIIASLTLMRDSEIQGIRRNSIVTHHGSPAVTSKVVKQNWSQEDRYWWAADAVVNAVKALESQHDGPWIFGVFKEFTSDRSSQPPRLLMLHSIHKFIKHINSNHERWGVSPIETTVNARRLRRTMAVIAGAAINGPIDVALQLKHATRYAVANQLSSAYAAPDAEWTRAFNKAQEEATAKFLKELGEQASKDPQLKPTGPGARRALSAGHELEQTFFSGVVDDGSIAHTLSEFGVGILQEGPVSYCLGDPNVALCLSSEEKARGASPNPVKCRPDRCTNSFVMRKQQEQLTEELHELKKRSSETSSAHSATVLNERISEIERLLFEEPEDEPGKR